MRGQRGQKSEMRSGPVIKKNLVEESQNYRMSWVGRDPQGSLNSYSCPCSEQPQKSHDVPELSIKWFLLFMLGGVWVFLPGWSFKI